MESELDLIAELEYYEMLNDIVDRYGKDGLLRLIRIFDIIEDLDKKINKKITNERSSTQKI